MTDTGIPTLMLVYLHTCMHTYVYTCKAACIDLYMSHNMDMHRDKYAHTYTLICTNPWICVHALTDICMHTYIHT